MSRTKEQSIALREIQEATPKVDTWLSNATDGRVQIVTIHHHNDYIKSLPTIKNHTK